MQDYQSVRSNCGFGRVRYNETAKGKKFDIIYRGTVCNSSYTLEGAIQNLQAKGCKFTKPYIWK